jgi:toxin YoeB
MSFDLEITPIAESDIIRHKKSGNKKVLNKINILLDELRESPYSGTGKPEQLKHYNYPTWSRRINDKHRLIYRIKEEVKVVLILSLWGHYDDK